MSPDTWNRSLRTSSTPKTRKLGLERLEQIAAASSLSVLGSALGDMAQVGQFSQQSGVNYVDQPLVNDSTGGGQFYLGRGRRLLPE